MAKIRKRANSWQIELAKRVTLIAEKRYLAIKKECSTTLGELTARYEENYRHLRSFKKGKEFYLRNFKEYFGADTLLDRVKYLDLETYKNSLRDKLTRQGRIRRPATINHEMICLHQLFEKAVEWEMIEKSPFDKGSTLYYKNLNNERKRYLTQEEIERLLACCPNQHPGNIVELAINIGMRRQEILTLKWQQIKDGFIYLTKTKTDEAREIPIFDTVAELLNSIRKKRVSSFEYVFCNMQGHPYKSIETSFQRVKKKARIRDFTFHDLRHTFASHSLMRGGSLSELQQILGHSNPKTTMRYAHLSKDHQKRSITRMSGLTRTVSHSVTHSM
jgi:integrase